MDEINLNIDNLESATLNISDDDFGAPQGNFGSGIELLMNTKKVSGGGGSKGASFDLGDLDSLETELNNLSGSTPNASTQAPKNSDSKFMSGISNLFGFGDKGSDAPTAASTSNLGKATKEGGEGVTKSWDGFMKFSDVPSGEPRNVQNRMTDREKFRKKKMMISRLEEWREKGIISSSSHFSQDMPYEEVEDEYETALEDKKKKEAKKLYSWWFMTAVNTLEYANAAFNPFDINLDGWGEAVNDDMDSYDEVFGKLYDKYKGGEMSPELTLVMRLGFSAAVTSFTNKALSSATPGFNDVIRQSPELMKMFSNATVSSMSQQSPGFAFANNLVNPVEQSNSKGMGPPPAAVDPKKDANNYNSNQFSRPDLNMSRGTMFREQGVDIKNNQAPASGQRRPEMMGPRNTNVDSILSGLKTKTVDLNQRRDEDSVMSVSSLKDLQDATMPRSGKGRKGSNKNVVSLDI
jgi:hypothetical protein